MARGMPPPPRTTASVEPQKNPVKPPSIDFHTPHRIRPSRKPAPIHGFRTIGLRKIISKISPIYPNQLAKLLIELLWTTQPSKGGQGAKPFRCNILAVNLL